MKVLFISILLIALFVKPAFAANLQFNIICDLAPDVGFYVFSEKDEFTQSYMTAAGLTYQKTEAGNPALCQMDSGSSDQIVILNCEDQNISSFDYKLKFTKDYKTAGVFTILKINKNSKEEEYKLCQSLN